MVGLILDSQILKSLMIKGLEVVFDWLREWPGRHVSCKKLVAAKS